MADYTPTPANVMLSGLEGSAHKDVVAGTAIGAGDAITIDSATKRAVLADANDPNKRRLDGIALNGASNGQPLRVAIQDPQFSPGFTVEPGDIIILSDTPGKLAPASDVSEGLYVTIVMVGGAGNKARLGPFLASDAPASAESPE